MRVKFPRTMHFPWSQGLQNDDKMITTTKHLEGRRGIATIKKDGESASCYRDHYHARSLDSLHHPSRDWMKSFWGTFRHDIPENYRVCGENLYARHSIAYDDLKSFFYGFHVWDDRNVCLSWKDTLEWFALLGITPVEVVYEGVYDEKVLKKLAADLFASGEEGLVWRVEDEIPYDDYGILVGKDVRKGHVQTDQHWMHAEIVPIAERFKLGTRRIGRVNRQLHRVVSERGKSCMVFDRA
ncbi:MAG: 2'-5' RNA ligase [Verrucomicrobiaceae bacterium]|nr:MAG: 2'-5' RNA ligase [Verrucomicrobiaceae bacterium]